LSMFVYTADLVLLVGFSQSRTPVCVCVCVFVNRVTTTPQNFSALLDPSSYSFLSNSDLSVEVHLWRRVRFPSRGFRISYQRHMSHVARKVILRQISGDRRFCACLRTQETWSYLLGSVSREPVCVFLVNRANTTPRDFSALLDPSRHSFLSKSDLSVEVHLYRPVRFPSRAFRISSEKHMSRVA
jgi:hypothetical protein